jgi:FAD:protein FMN transferase
MRSPSRGDVVRARPLLGTFVRIRAGGAASPVLERAVAAAYREIERIQSAMSFHDPASELSLVNRDAARRQVRITRDLFAVLTLARDLFEATDGVFDISVAPHLVRWGYLPRTLSSRHTGTLAAMELLPRRGVRFHMPLLIDLGGIAKGYAVDRAVAVLQGAGAGHGVVNAGGDLRVFGPQSELVHVRHPAAPGSCVPLAKLRDAALATSALYFSRRRHRGRIVSPIIDPARRAPCTTSRSVSVVAPTCAVADALTKVVALRDADAFRVLTSWHASALILDANGEVRTSESASRAA